MITPSDVFYLAADFHRELLERIRQYLNGRGISDEIINRRFLGWNGSQITIPIFNRKGVCTTFRLAKDPDDTSDIPKMLPLRGSRVDLYGWEVLRRRPNRVIVCEGEFDRLVLESNGFDAVTSTGGAGTFRREWADELSKITQVYVCFDNDEAGRKGSARVARMIPGAKIVKLPTEVGDGGDVTDYFVRLKKTADDFEKLLLDAVQAPPEELNPKRQTTSRLEPAMRERVEHIKRAIPIEQVVGSYVELRNSGSNLAGLCPFHDDHKPSLRVFPKTRTFYCFGCGAHGDVIGFLRKAEHLTFRQALDALEQLQTNDETRAA